jgi:hypothetical protein
MERVSDADRQRVVDELKGHCAAGRLSLDEYVDRVEEVMTAQTVAELSRARRELPFLRIPDPSPGEPDARLPSALVPVLAVIVIALGVVAAAVLTLRWLWVPALVLAWLLGVAQGRLLRGRSGLGRRQG